MHRPQACLVLCVCLALASTDANAETPWSYELSTEREQELLTEAGDNEDLDDEHRQLLALAVAQGMLLATATCESSGTVQELVPGGAVQTWIGEVQNAATVLVSNLSDQPVWLVDASVSPIAAATALERPPGEELGSWSANLPFIPPHSQARILMGCNTLTAGVGASFDKIDAQGSAGPMTPALARKLATTPARFHSESSWDKTVTAREPEARSLASYALPWIDDRAGAKLLLEAIRRHGDEYVEGDEFVGRTAPWMLGRDLARAPLATAHGIVDVIEDDPPEQLAALLGAALRDHSGDNDDALLRLAASVCERSEPAVVEELLIEQLGTHRPREWIEGLLQACLIAPEQTRGLVERLAVSARGKTRASALSRFIALAPSPYFELTLSLLLGAEPEAYDAELAAIHDPALRPPPVLEILTKTPAPNGEDEVEEPYVPKVIDGGQRPEVLWIAMASSPPPERLALLESYVRPEDTARILALLIPWKMDGDRFALFDRISARLDELPAERIGEALEPVIKAGLASPYLERELLDRLFILAERDRDRLRPLTMKALAKNQSVFTSAAVVTLPHEHGELLELFAGPLQACDEAYVARDCYDALAADPRLLSAAHIGLKPELLARLGASSSPTDPNDEQREFLRLVVPLGVDVTPIAAATCERAKELASFEAEVDAHVEFLQEFAPDQACLAELQAKLGAGTRTLTYLIGGLLCVLGLIGLGVLRSRRRQAQLLADS